MAYQAGASLGQFWDAMLQLRAQRLQEEEMKQKQQMQMMQFGASLGSQFSSGISQGMQSRQQDAMYNRRMNQMDPPSAQAVDPAMQRQFTGEIGAPHTGGKAEMVMEMAMAKQQSAMLAQKALTDQRIIGTAQRAMSMASKPFQDSLKNITAYTSNIDALGEAMQKGITTGNRQLYDQSVKSANALYQSLMETNPKTSVAPPDIPPFITPEQRQAIEGAQQGISALRGAPAEGSWFPDTAGQLPGAYGWAARKLGLGNVDMPGQTAAEAMKARESQIGTLEKEMQNLPGAREYLGAGAGAATGTRATPQQAGQIVNGWPLGQKRVHRQTGEVIIWNGREWEKQK